LILRSKNKDLFFNYVWYLSQNTSASKGNTKTKCIGCYISNRAYIWSKFCDYHTVTISYIWPKFYDQ
jgi:hypothetical protein